MPISRVHFAAQLREGLEWAMNATPEEIEERRQQNAAAYAEAAARARAEYDALDLQGKAEYDALTRGMMPRARGVQELTPAEIEMATKAAVHPLAVDHPANRRHNETS